MTKTLRDLFIILLLFASVWLGFTFVDFEFNSIDSQLSLEKEASIADLIMEDYLSNNKVLKNSTLDSAMFQIKTRLEEGLSESNYDYKIYVVQNDQLNAFATLDGNMVIFSGLIKFVDNAEELSAVLAHELGHVEKRHVVNKLIKELGITLILTVATGGDPAIISEVMRNIVSTVFDRKQETEADEFGLDLLEKSKINPLIMGTTFRKLKKELDVPYSEEMEFLMTHPNMNKRIKMALNYKTKSNFEPNPFIINWKNVQQSLDTIE